MHTSAHSNIPASSISLHTKLLTLLMVFLCTSLALYPILLNLISPVLYFSFALTFVLVIIGLPLRHFRVPHSFILYTWLSFSFIYIFWLFVSVIYGNNLLYVYQDSAGFILYLVVLPVLYLFILHNHLQRFFFLYIEHLSRFIALFSIFVALIVYLLFGGISTDSIVAIHSFANSFGLAWKIDHNSEVLGLYTNVAHLVLLGNALALYRFSRSLAFRDLLWIISYILALFFDGRRGLVVAEIMQLLIVAPLIFCRLTSLHRAISLFVIIFALGYLLFPNIDWILNRFTFTSADPSSYQRYTQIPALIRKIDEKPLLGNGFGSFASVIRSTERPFSYEVDFLATFMKLGLVGGLLYFCTYLYGVFQALRIRDSIAIYLISAGVPFFFFMGTNGNQAMSTDSSVFHIFLFLTIAFSQSMRYSSNSTSIPLLSCNRKCS